MVLGISKSYTSMMSKFIKDCTVPVQDVALDMDVMLEYFYLNTTKEMT